MSRGKWKQIQKRKGFYQRNYRILGSVLVLSTILNLILGLSVGYHYLNRKDNKFYATNGAMPPEELTPMDQRNMTSVSLLPDDPVNDEEAKVIPQ